MAMPYRSNSSLSVDLCPVLALQIKSQKPAQEHATEEPDLHDKLDVKHIGVMQCEAPAI